MSSPFFCHFFKIGSPLIFQKPAEIPGNLQYQASKICFLVHSNIDSDDRTEKNQNLEKKNF